MAKVYTHPHWETHVIDRSIYTPLERETLPLFRPIFFMRAAKGPVNVPTFCYTYNEAKEIFGEETFDFTTEYFSREALYLNQLFSRQGAFIVRLADEATAEYASLVVEVQVKETEVPQWERDEYGNFVKDANGNKTALLEEGVQKVEPGIELKWQVRQLGENESITNLKVTTVNLDDGQAKIYPIFALKANTVGKALNNIGIKFFADSDLTDMPLCDAVSSMQYQFGVVSKDYSDSSVAPVYSDLDNQIEAFIAKPDQIDTRVDANVSFADVIEQRYEEIIPFEINYYAENVEAIGQRICAVETDDPTLNGIDTQDVAFTMPFMANITDDLNIEGVPYAHVVLAADSIVLNNERVLYLAGGTDGNIDDETIEDLTCNYLKGVVYPEIVDQSRYPFTHIIDTGVSMTTKKAFIQFLGVDDACKVVLATQAVSMGRFNTKAEDLSAGHSLYNACLLQPESVEKGTECCRAEIYQQAGYLANNAYKGIVPSTYDVMMKKSLYGSTPSITGNPGGLPNSAITVFRKWNWTPYDADHKQKSWETGLNYFQYYDMSSIHWPAMRSVYRYDTSTLSSASFSDVVVYTKHVARYNWSKYAGVEMDFDTMSSHATVDLTADLLAMLNGLYNFTVSFEQSDEEARIGYISHAIIQLWANPQQRVWKIDIECYRNGYDPTSEETE